MLSNAPVDSLIQTASLNQAKQYVLYFVIVEDISPISASRSTFYFVISLSAVAVLMSIIFMFLTIGSKRLAVAIIPQGTVINDIILWKYFLINFQLHSLRNLFVRMTRVTSHVIFFVHSTNMY